MIDFADLDTDPMTSTARAVSTSIEIQRNAHIANGGQVAMFDCPRCHGTGSWRGHTRAFPCRACEGKGKVTKGKIAAFKGKATKAANLASRRIDFEEANAELMAGLRAVASWHGFAAKMLDAVATFGSLTDNQRDAAKSVLAKIAEKRAAERQTETAAKSGAVGVERINALFATAIGNGLKKPIFRTENLVIKPAKLHAGVLYVTDKRVEDRERGGAAYVGKIVEGKFEARREAMADTLSILCEIAADPMESAVRYGRATGVCGCCGRELTDKDSVAAGIGPICATKWGL
ncbi:DUF6011 domain-containing protein [Mesorhizobium sp. Cs1299R1N3]|uniref:DUF6011 domain-containing protein n=1 Tax=Mesorhizobium sp. Cs1299R1N3 TaxID=3015173 RepID=UPI00301B8CBB